MLRCEGAAVRIRVKNIILAAAQEFPSPNTREDQLSNERQNFCAHLRQFFGGYSALLPSLPTTPIQALQLIGQDNIHRRTGDKNLERIVFDLRRHGIADHQACFVVIRRRAQHHGRPVPRLLVPCL
jgi:hypothetical protein